MEHVSTQLPYALVVAVSSAVGYLVAGISHGNLWLSFGVALFVMVSLVSVLHFMKHKRAGALA